jgi:hypothetical protein
MIKSNFRLLSHDNFDDRQRGETLFFKAVQTVEFRRSVAKIETIRPERQPYSVWIDTKMGL